ncbi:pilin [Undibacterium rugosum]|uniref:Pilin n=1 Tax=Undibacterium rugosum TaxID=2762291 RepID=A0A923I5Q3_9BURK|nr:pilin [Undibacterium rugosum]MBC3936041.1 pilin [Undibacterium rugosum]MBR7778626.1 pilin [Undibacterium rugosum]
MKSRRLLKNIQRGFTLIELMIVVAIIGILAAVALPAYNDYTTRAQVAEAVELLGGLKGAVAAYGYENSSWPTMVTSSSTVAATNIVATLSGKYATVTPSVTGTFPSGIIKATMQAGQASSEIVGLATTNGGQTWNCSSGNGVTTVDKKWLPQACK